MCVGVGVTDVVTVCVSPLVCVCVGVGSRVTDVVTVRVSSLVCVCVCWGGHRRGNCVRAPWLLRSFAQWTVTFGSGSLHLTVRLCVKLLSHFQLFATP